MDHASTRTTSHQFPHHAAIPREGGGGGGNGAQLSNGLHPGDTSGDLAHEVEETAVYMGWHAFYM